MAFPVWLNYTFLAVGLLFSFFYGLKACDAFGVDAKGKPWAWHVHQFWFNAAGSAVGWSAAWFVARRVWHHMAATPPAELSWSDAGFIAVAFVGITGHLPFATAGVLEGIKALALKVAGLGK
jgi:hypothetical protein